jgi:glycosyltransferase involved in cell wall biosynthesis
MIKKLAYVRTGWLPTRQANGIQTVRMCEAFAKLGVEITLYYITSPVLRDDIFNYYGVATPFRLKTLPRAILPLRKSFTWQGWTRFPLYVHGFLWAGLVTYAAQWAEADLYYTRDAMVAWWLGRLGLLTALEVHSPPTPMNKVFLRTAASCKSVTLVVSVSEHLRRNLISLGIPESKTMTLQHGVDMGWFNSSVSKEEARQRLGLSYDRELIVYAGQLDVEKGVDTLVKAALALPNSVFMLVGGTRNDIERLKNITSQAEAKNLLFTGYVPVVSVPLYLKAADILVLPQSARCSYTTFPLKLLEYMASDRPIIATRVPYLMEVLEHGQNAWLVEADDPLSLAEGLRGC